MLSDDVDSFKSLKELILMEHFTNLADKEIGTKIREKRFRTVKEVATWDDNRVLALKASGVKPVGICVILFIRDKHANGAALGIRSTYQVKEKREGDKSYQAKSLPSSSRLSCFYCKQEGHIKSNRAKLKATLTPKPVALVIGSGKNSEGGLECGRSGNVVLDSLGASLQCSSMGKTSVSFPLVRPPSERSLGSGLDWCKPFMCQGTVNIGRVAYTVTVFRDNGAKQSVCRNVTGESVSTGRYVLSRGINSVEYYDLLAL